MDAKDDNNIDVFDLTVGEYFAQLYAVFPVRMDLQTYPVQLESICSDKVILPSLRLDKETIDWDYDKISEDLSTDHLPGKEVSELEKKYFEEINALKKTFPKLISKRKELEKLSLIRTETADWLHKSGFISVDNVKQVSWNTSLRWASKQDTVRDKRFLIYKGIAKYSVYEGTRLTTKGLEVLKAVPATVSGADSMTSVGVQLVKQLKDGAVDTRKAAISKLVGEAISMGVGIMS